MTDIDIVEVVLSVVVWLAIVPPFVIWLVKAGETIDRQDKEITRLTDALEAAMSKHGIRIAVIEERERIIEFINDDFYKPDHWDDDLQKHSRGGGSGRLHCH